MKALRVACLTSGLLMTASILAPLCYGQVLPILPLIYMINGARSRAEPTYQQGTYQLKDGSWKEGKLMLRHDKALVVGQATKQEGATEFSPDEVQMFVTGQDTFGVIRNFDIPEPAEHITAGFAQQLYRGGGFLLSRYTYFRPNSVAAKSYTVLFHGEDAPAIVPTKAREFRKFILTYVGDHPTLAKPNSWLEPKNASLILGQYVRWKKQQPTSAPPAAE